MRKTWTLIGAMFIVLILFTGSVFGLSSYDEREIVPGQFVVLYADGRYDVRETSNPVSMLMAEEGDSLSHSWLYEQMALALEAEDVVYVEPVYYLRLESFVPNDLKAVDAWRFDAISLTGLWERILSKYANHPSVLVAVLDDGITPGHADLNVLEGFDFGDNDLDTTPSGSHGNHVAGIIGARGNNGIGIVGVMPGVQLLPVKVFKNNGQGTTTDLAKGIDYAVSRGAHVINMSLSYGQYSSMVEASLIRALEAGVILVAATGNDASLWDNASMYNEKVSLPELNPTFMRYPALHSQVVAVGSVQRVSGATAVSDFSNIGEDYDVSHYQDAGAFFAGRPERLLDVVAPGSRITSTFYDVSNPSNATIEKSGTSMATPHVSGLFALLRAQYPSLASSYLMEAVVQTASTASIVTPTLDDVTLAQMLGHGIIHVEQALTYYLPQGMQCVYESEGMVVTADIDFDPLSTFHDVTLGEGAQTFRLKAPVTSLVESYTFNGVSSLTGESQLFSIYEDPLVIKVNAMSKGGHVEPYDVVVYPHMSPSSSDLYQIVVGEGQRVLLPEELDVLYYVPYGLNILDLHVIPRSGKAVVEINDLVARTLTYGVGSGLQDIHIRIESEDQSQQSHYVLRLERDNDVRLRRVYYRFDDTVFVEPSPFIPNRFLTIFEGGAQEVILGIDQGFYMVPYDISKGSDEWLEPLSGLRQVVSFQVSYGDESKAYEWYFDSDEPIDGRAQSLSLSAGVLIPGFERDRFQYTATVPFEQSVLSITAIGGDPRVPSVSVSVPLAVGVNTVAVNLMADAWAYPEGGMLSTYTVQVTRLESAAPIVPTQPVSPPIAPPSTVAPPILSPPVEAMAEDIVFEQREDGAFKEIHRPLVQQVSSAEAVEIIIPKPQDTSVEQEVIIDEALLKTIKLWAKPVVLSFDSVRVGIPIEAIQRARSTFSFSVSIEPNRLSPIFTFQFMRDGKVINRLEEPVAMVLPFGRVSEAERRRLAVFYYNPMVEDWQYAGGKFMGDGSMVFETSHFSKYAVKRFFITFSDIESHWAKEAIELIGSLKLVAGVGEGRFAPDDVVTHAQFITMLSNALVLPERDVELPFSDVLDDVWYTDFLKRAYGNGLLEGAFEASFYPNEPVPRERMAYLLVRAYTYLNGIEVGDLLIKEEVVFKDEGLLDANYRDSVRLAYQLGLIRGNPDGYFLPQDVMTRAQAVSVLKVLLDR